MICINDLRDACMQCGSGYTTGRQRRLCCLQTQPSRQLVMTRRPTYAKRIIIWADISAKLSPVCPAKCNANSLLYCVPNLWQNKFDISDRLTYEHTHTHTHTHTSCSVAVQCRCRSCTLTAGRPVPPLVMSSSTSSLQDINKKRDEASTHKSAKTHAGNVFVTLDLDLLTPK